MSRPGGASHDLTQGPIASTLLAFALPTLGSNVLQSLNGSINAVWVGRFLGENALAAVSIANLVMFLLFAAIFGFAMAGTVLVGQHVGRHDTAGARKVIGSAVTLLTSVAVIVTIVGWFTSSTILHAMATPPQALPLASAYLRIVFLFMPASFLFMLLMMGLRGTGDAMTPLIYTGLSVVLAVGLNPLFILGWGPIPPLGIAGSAWANLIANYVSLFALVIHIYARDLTIRLRGREWRYLIPARSLVRPILFKGFPIGLQMLVGSLASIASIGLVNRYGVETTAAYGVAAQIWAYIQMPAMAIGAAVSAMAAQNIGADNWERVGRITRWGIIFNLTITGGMVALLIVADRFAVELFLGANSPAVPIAQHINFITNWAYILFGVHFVLSGTMRANGAVGVPLVILFVALFPVRLGIAFGLTPIYGADALWWSWPAGAGAAMLMAIAYYRHGGWRRLRMEEPPDAIEMTDAIIAESEPTGQMHPIANT
jgi:putative MATE family efflux protein